MSEIKVGDLVVVAQWPCCGVRLGAMRTIVKVYSATYSTCVVCGSKTLETQFAALSGEGNSPIAWLKRIPPLSELEGARDALSERTPQKAGAK